MRSRGESYGSALIEGIKKLIPIFLYNKCDGSMNPKYLEEMLNLCKNQDLVFASRYLEGGGSDDDDFITFIGNKIFSLLGNIFFRLIYLIFLYLYIRKTSSAKNLDLKYNDFRICVEIPILAKSKNYKFVSHQVWKEKELEEKKSMLLRMVF